MPRTTGARTFIPEIHPSTPEVKKLFALGVPVSELGRRYSLSRHCIHRMLSCILPERTIERQPDTRLAQMIPSSEVQ